MFCILQKIHLYKTKLLSRKFNNYFTHHENPIKIISNIDVIDETSFQ